MEPETLQAIGIWIIKIGIAVIIVMLTVSWFMNRRKGAKKKGGPHA